MLDPKTVSKTEYLYGVEDIEHIPEEFIKYRIQKLKNHLENLLTVQYMERDNGRVNKVIKAIEFWQNIKDN